MERENSLPSNGDVQLSMPEGRWHGSKEGRDTRKLSYPTRGRTLTRRMPTTRQAVRFYCRLYVYRRTHLPSSGFNARMLPSSRLGSNPRVATISLWEHDPTLLCFGPFLIHKMEAVKQGCSGQEDGSVRKGSSSASLMARV